MVRSVGMSGLINSSPLLNTFTFIHRYLLFTLCTIYMVRVLFAWICPVLVAVGRYLGIGTGGGRGRVASGRPLPRDRRNGEREAGQRPGASRLENGTVEVETGQCPGVSSLGIGTVERETGQRPGVSRLENGTV